MKRASSAEAPISKSTSVKNQFDLLANIVRHPDTVEPALCQALMSALASQGALASFSWPDLGIVGMSLNTHKTIAGEAVEGGYQALNEYRKAALAKLKGLSKKQERAGRGTIEWYKAELAEKNESLARMANEIALMGQRLDEILSLSQEMAIKSNQIEEFQKRRGELLRKFK